MIANMTNDENNIIAVRKVNFGNGAAHLNWKCEPVGTKLYYRISKQDGRRVVKLSKKASAYDIDSLVVKKLETTKGVYQQYLNVLGVLDGPGYYQIRKSGPDYVIEPATEENVKRYALIRGNTSSGAVKRTAGAWYIMVSEEEYRRLCSKGALVVTVHMDERLYVEAHPVTPETAAKYPALNQLGGYKALPYKQEFTYRYGKNLMAKESFRRLSLPKAFLEKIPTDQLHVWFRDDDTFIVEGNPIYCDICGKPINRYFDGAYEIHVCSKCAELVKEKPQKMRKISKETKTEVLSLLTEAKKVLQTMMEED